MLPIDAVIPDLVAALERQRVAVLVAPPGAGKTTGAPLALLDAKALGDHRIILLAPRRLAARAAAARMAAVLAEPVGRTVGYRVRLESRVSAHTRIEVVTEGVFTRMILDDPTLAGVGAVILDEFHERSLEGDLALALARDCQTGLREDLWLLVMSATLDAARVSALLGDAPVVESQGKAHSVELRYLGRDPRAPIEDQVAAAVRRAITSVSGDLLCFLPGAAEIERCRRSLEDAGLGEAIDVHPLFGAMDPRDQDAAIQASPPGRRKVVLATSIAETSLTIEGVRGVIDSGLSRRPLFDPGVGLTRLATVRVSQASATQRAGRAGRVAAGICWRLWDEGETRSLAPFDRPEILEADLAGFALDLAAWGLADPAGLIWMDPPPRAGFADARALLADLGALDCEGRLTPHGTRLSEFGLAPRLAHMVMESAAVGEGRTAARVAAILSEQGLSGRDVDLRERLASLNRDRSPRAQAALGLAQRWARRAGAADDEAIALDAAGRILARAYPERVAKARVVGSGEVVMANGRAAAVDPTDALAREPFLAVGEAVGRADRMRVHLAAPLSLADIEVLFRDRIAEAEEVSVDPASLTVRGRRVRRFGRLVLSAAPMAAPSGAAAAQALLDWSRAVGAHGWPWSETAIQLRARVALLRRLDGEASWPDWGDAALESRLEDWLGPAVDGLRAVADIEWHEALRAGLSFDQRRRLDAGAPLRFETPAGGSALIDYACDGGPAVDVRLQELFGLAMHPAVADGRAPLLLRLLSPAQRPVQTTRDLPGFWAGTYSGVRAEMRGRYPKHAWPEDPLSAPPTRRAKPKP